MEDIVETATLDTDTAEETPVTREFSFHDRCDRCGFQAYFVAMRNGKELTFCGHHGKEHTPALAAGGWDVLDFTDRINEKPSVSANAG